MKAPITKLSACAIKWIRALNKKTKKRYFIERYMQNAKQPFCCTIKKLRQFKILNRLYYTPLQLYKMCIWDDGRCIKCSAAEGTLLYLSG